MKTSELFNTPPFLEQRLGPEVFTKIPQQPGIYRFYDKNDTLLYVGKAKNLRNRLFTYKRAKPGKTSRKVAMLISKIDRFEFDILESEQDAFLQENYWIREHRPEFNYANKHTETYYFITLQRLSSGLMVGLSMNSSGILFPETDKPLYKMMHSPFPGDADVKVYGCFKGHRTVRTSLGALLQLLWLAEHQAISPHFLPVQLSRNLTPMRFKMSFHQESPLDIEKLMTLLDEWFLGISADVIQYLLNLLPETKTTSFTNSFLKETTELLLTYFQKNLERYRIFREARPSEESHLIHQHELDDLITTTTSNIIKE